MPITHLYEIVCDNCGETEHMRCAQYKVIYDLRMQGWTFNRSLNRVLCPCCNGKKDCSPEISEPQVEIVRAKVVAEENNTQAWRVDNPRCVASIYVGYCHKCHHYVEGDKCLEEAT